MVIENEENKEQVEETTDSQSTEATQTEATGEETAQEEPVSEDANAEAHDELAETTAALEELKDKHLRLQAEFDNFRRRTIKEKADLIAQAGERVLCDLLPVIDNFDRALDSIATAESVEGVKEGIDLIYSQFQSFLTKQGVAEIEAKEKDFDADQQEAIARFPVEEEAKKGKVIDVTQKGYTLNGKVIRFAKVVVGE